MSKKPNHWFYLCKKCTIKMCIFIQKKHMSFGKKPQLIKWFNLLLLKLTPPQKLLYKPRLFYSNHPIHRNIELWTTSTTWTPAGLSSPGPSSTITRSSTTGCWIPPRPQGRRSSRSPKASLRTSSLRSRQQRRSSLEGCCHQRNFATSSNSLGRTSQRIGCSETRRRDISC